jgi:hypothetical protein
MTRCPLYIVISTRSALGVTAKLSGRFVTVTTKRRRSPHNPTTVSPVGYSANGGHHDPTFEPSDTR